MAEHRPQEEWAAVIAEIEQNVSSVEGKTYAPPDLLSTALAKTIDHTLLKLDARDDQFDQLCAEAREYGFATVCVRPERVASCVAQLKGSDVQVASVIGFHEGTYGLAHKSQETALSLASGAHELDIVLNYPLLQTGAYSTIATELAALRAQALPPTRLKLILETSQLSRAQIIAACVLADGAGLDFVKTSTGFNGPGATVENVRLMRACCEALAARDDKEERGQQQKKKMEVKASGGVRSLEDAKKMLAAGASRLGTSAGVVIAEEARRGHVGKTEKAVVVSGEAY